MSARKRTIGSDEKVKRLQRMRYALCVRNSEAID